MSVGLGSMAWRNLWRNRRRTLVTLASIAFGTMLAVLFTGIGDGYMVVKVEEPLRFNMRT